MGELRYALANRGGLLYAIEDPQYEKSHENLIEPGITNEDIDPPNPNEHTAMAHGGAGRSVFANSPNEREYEFDVPVVVHDSNVPFELALGSRAELDDPAGVVFEERDRLPTATFVHYHEDLDLQSSYVGCKADLEIEWDEEDPLLATFSITAAALEADTDANFGSNDAAAREQLVDTRLTEDVTPFRAHMVGDVTLSNPDDGSNGIHPPISTVIGGSLSWENGLEPQYHGSSPNSDSDGRDAYAVAETTAADGRYDWTLTMNVTDTELFERAYENRAPVDVEIPFVRGRDGDTRTDAVIIRGKRCVITDAPISAPAEGVVEVDVQVLPEATEIELRTQNEPTKTPITTTDER